jgi:hypothetical protein
VSLLALFALERCECSLARRWVPGLSFYRSRGGAGYMRERGKKEREKQRGSYDGVVLLPILRVPPILLAVMEMALCRGPVHLWRRTCGRREPIVAPIPP